MSRRLVITGDDFGASREVNAAIFEAHERGILTHASLMVTGDACAEAVEIAKKAPRLSVGLHLVVLDGRCALPPGEVPGLVDSRGRFSQNPVGAGMRYFFRPSIREQLRREVRAQLERFRETGLTLSHVDGHHHLHLHPIVMSCLAELAAEFRIPVVRLPREELSLAVELDSGGFPSKVLWAAIFGRLRANGERKLRSAGVAFADRVYGLLATGRITEEYLLGLIPRIRAETVEIYSHPRADPGGFRELAALVSSRVRDSIGRAGFALARP